MKLLNILLLSTSIALTLYGGDLKYPQRSKVKQIKRIYVIYPKEFIQHAEQLSQALPGYELEKVEDIVAVKGWAKGLREEYCSSPVIIIGNLEQNQALIELYAKFMTDADAVTPGKDGILIQQIPNRNIPGSHAVVIAGSIPEATRLAVEKYITELKTGKAPFSIQIYDFNSDIPQKYKQEAIQTAGRYMKAENTWGNFHNLAEAHRFTGDAKYAEAANASAEKMVPIKDNHYGMGLVIQGWDYWARSGLLSGALTQKVDQLFLDYLVNEQGSWWRRRENKAFFADNRHHVYGTWGYYQTALMLYRGLDEKQRENETGRFIKSKIDECEQWFSACTREYVPEVLSAGVFINLNIFSLYSMQSGDLTLFESGRAKEYVRLTVAATDNTGCSIGVSGYEDTYSGAWLEGYPIGGVINIAAYYYQSPKYIWLKGNLPGFNNSTWWSLNSDRHSYAIAGFALKPASDFLGFIPVFSKDDYPLYVAFRTGFDKNDLAFCVTGSGTGEINLGDSGKGRQVYPNMIPRLSWNGVSWLVQNTNCVTPDYRNALSVVCSNASSLILKNMKTVFSGGDKGTFFYAGLAEKYCGSDWQRSFVISGNDFMLVEDSLTALESGDVSGAVTWRTPYHSEKADNKTVVVGFDGKLLNFQAVSAQALAISTAYPGKEGSLSPYVIRQEFSESLEGGGSVSVANLIYPGEKYYDIRIAAPHVYAIRDIRDDAVFLIGFGEFNGGGLQIGAKVFSLSTAGWKALEGKLEINGKQYSRQELPTALKEILKTVWDRSKAIGNAGTKMVKLSAPGIFWRFDKFEKIFPLISGYQFSSAGASDLAMAFDGNIKRDKKASWGPGEKLDIELEFQQRVILRQIAMLYNSDGSKGKLYRNLPDKVSPVKVSNLDSETSRDVKTDTVPYFELDETYKGAPYTYTGAMAQLDVPGKKFRIQSDATSLFQMRLYGGDMIIPKITDAIMFGKDKLLVRNEKNEVVCIDADSGLRLWRTQIPFTVISWSAGRENIALGCIDSTVKGLAPDSGEILWSTDTSGIALGMPYSVAPMKNGFIFSSYYHMNPVGPDGRLYEVAQKTLAGMWLYDVMGDVDLDSDGVPDAISRALWGHINLYDGKTGKVDYFANMPGQLVSWELIKGSDDKPDLLVVARDGIGLYDAHIRKDLLFEGWDAAPDEDALLLEKRSKRLIWSSHFNSAVSSFARFGDELVLGFRTGMIKRFTLSGKELKSFYPGSPVLDINAADDRLLVNSGEILSVYDRDYKLLARHSLKNSGIKVFDNGLCIVAFTAEGIIRLKI